MSGGRAMSGRSGPGSGGAGPGGVAPSLSSFEVVINGERVTVSGVSTTTTALTWLRESGRTGTKEGCAEGDCGACTIGIVERPAPGTAAGGEPTIHAVNSCLVLLPTLAGREIVTVEGVAARAERPGAPRALHPVQRAMVERNGSQCGFCTPGLVMSMIEAYYRADLPNEPAEGRAAVIDQLAGNICRCTGYRPIREAALDALGARAEAGAAPGVAGAVVGLSRGGPGAGPAGLGHTGPLDYRDPAGARLLRPTALADLLAIKAQYGSEAVLLGGATEIGVAVNKSEARFPLLVATDGVPDLRAIERDEDEWRVGGAVTLTALEDALGEEYPYLRRMLRVFASRQVRHAATLAGNLATAAPIGDMAPVLLALDAAVVLERAGGSRRVALAEFVTGYRTTVLTPDEVIRWIVLPRRAALEARVAPGGQLLLHAAKVAGRREMATSTVAAGFAVGLDGEGRVVHARLAFAGVAATPWRARATEEALLGRAWPDAVGAAVEVLLGEVRPIDDLRGSAAYRRAVTAGLLERFAAGEHDGAPSAGTSPIDDDGFESTAPWAPAADGRELAHESAIAARHGRGAIRGRRRAPPRRCSRCGRCSPRTPTRGSCRSTPRRRARRPASWPCSPHGTYPVATTSASLRQDEPLFADAEVAYHGQLVALVVGGESGGRAGGGGRRRRPLRPAAGGAGDRRGDRGGLLPDRAARHPARRRRRGARREPAPAHRRAARSAGRSTSTSRRTPRGPRSARTARCSCPRPRSTRARCRPSSRTCSHLPRNKVVVQSPRMGGGFGGKETQATRGPRSAALAAEVTGRPRARAARSRRRHELTGKRHPFLARFEAGFDDDGALLALRRRSLCPTAAGRSTCSESICDRALFHLDNAYYVPAWRFDGAGRARRTRPRTRRSAASAGRRACS